MTEAQIWETGNSLVITIPKRDKEKLKLKKGDWVDLKIKKK